MPSLLALGGVAAVAVLAGFVQLYTSSCPGLADLKHAVVLVTGSSQGIGEELALQYAGRGAHLILAARKRVQLEAVAERARAAGAASVLVVPTDMALAHEVQGLIDATIARHGGLDILLLNHAAVDDTLFTEHANAEAVAASLSSVLLANVVGSAAAARAALPFLEASPRGGHIAVISSATAKVPAPFHAGYVASKRA